MEGFELPSPSVLRRTSESASGHKASENELRSIATVISETLANFDIPSRVVSWVAGPTVTLFEVEIAKGVRLNRVTALADDLALALASSTVRILAPIPGKALVGIEVPNVRRTSVTLGDVLAPAGEGGPLLLAIGKDVAGDPVLADLATMPHLLIGGTTGLGQVRGHQRHADVASSCGRHPPRSGSSSSTPSASNSPATTTCRTSTCRSSPSPRRPQAHWPGRSSEMERRLKVLQLAGAKNIGAYNALVQDGKGPEGADELPYLVIVIDELADLMMIAAKEVEDSIVQNRATGTCRGNTPCRGDSAA